MSHFEKQDVHKLPPYGDALANEPPYDEPAPTKSPPLPQMGVYGYDQPSEGQPWSQSKHVLVVQSTGLEPDKRPTDWTIPAILACLCCFWPTGAVAIMYASKASTAYGVRNNVEAKRNAKMAMICTLSSCVVGIPIIVSVTTILYLLRFTSYF